MHKHGQSNISNPNTGDPMSDVLVIDYAEKKEVDVNFKSPFSVAAGFTHYSLDKKRVFYSTIEYFAKIDSYRLVHADSHTNPEEQYLNEEIDFTQWLTYYYEANPVFNVGIGYRWYLKKDLMLLTGFKTDFNHKKKYESNPLNPMKTIRSIDLNIYHITAGLTLRIMEQDITAGFQYSL